MCRSRRCSRQINLRRCRYVKYISHRRPTMARRDDNPCKGMVELFPSVPNSLPPGSFHVNKRNSPLYPIFVEPEQGVVCEWPPLAVCSEILELQADQGVSTYFMPQVLARVSHIAGADRLPRTRLSADELPASDRARVPGTKEYQAAVRTDPGRIRNHCVLGSTAA